MADSGDMLPGMPTRLFVATPTKMLTFADCKRKYRYTYLESPRPPKGPPWAHQTVGAVVHEVLADFLDGGRLLVVRRTRWSRRCDRAGAVKASGTSGSRWTGGTARPRWCWGTCETPIRTTSRAAWSVRSPS